jgi:opacity protein-like surface antigen
MHRTAFLAAALVVLAAAAAAADADDPTGLIGMDPAQAFAALGAPREIFAWRGAEPAEDDIVFFYPDFRYVFWFQSRVWQVRFDRRYEGTVLGFSIGMDDAEAQARGAGKLQEAGDSLYLAIDTGPFPVRVRLAMVDHRISDIYVYRSDW